MIKLKYSLYAKFFRYVSVGILNTLLHWIVFLIFHLLLGVNQATSNLIGFASAVTASFFLNAYWTFKVPLNIIRYVMFVSCLGSVNYLLGYLADVFTLSPVITLVLSSALSLMLGFVFSNFVVFRRY
jgi:putative flippase GtrA